jgi:DNA modification methylase
VSVAPESAVLVAVTRLWPAEWNANRVPPATLRKIRRSIERFGFVENLVVRPHPAERDAYEVLSGNHRLKLATEMGFAELPVILVDVDDAEARLLAQTLNRTRGTADDPEKYAAALEVILAGVGATAAAEVLPETEASLERALQSYRAPETVELQEKPAEPQSKPGEVYELGPHRLLCGDATSSDDVARLMGDERAALLFTSPPYADLRDYRGGDLSVDHLAKFIPAAAPFADVLAVNLGLTVRDHEIVPYWNAYLDAARGADLKLIGWNVWNREDATSMAAHSMTFPLWHEWVFVFARTQVEAHRTIPTKHAGKGTTIRQRDRDGRVKRGAVAAVNSHKRLGSVLTMACEKSNRGDHPAVFPVAFPNAYVHAVTNPGEIVLDPFAGSGSTLIAAEQAGRRCFSIELDPGYCDVIRARYESYVRARPAE